MNFLNHILPFIWKIKPPSKDLRIISPYKNRTNVYKGCIHCHSTRSDGGYTLQEITTLYKDLDYDFISITDHNDLPEDPEILGILWVPGMEWTGPTHVIRLLEKKPYTSVPLRSCITEGIEEGAFVIISHPDEYNTITKEAMPHTANGYHAIAVWNTAISVKQGYSGNYETYIDYLLSQGEKFYLVSEDDTHYKTMNPPFGLGGVFVFCNSLSLNDIMSNLFFGNFYSANADIALDISIEENVITATTDNPSKIEFIGKNGVIKYSKENTITASYTPVFEDKYIRIKVTRDSDDKNAWSNPIYIQ